MGCIDPLSQPQVAGCDWGSGSPVEGAVLVACSAPCWVGSSGCPDTVPWTPGLPGDCPRASGPLCGLSAQPVTAQVIGYCPQRTSSPGPTVPVTFLSLRRPWEQNSCDGKDLRRTNVQPTARTSHRTVSWNPPPPAPATFTQRNEHPKAPSRQAECP